MANLDLVVSMLLLGFMLATCASKCPRIRKVKNLRPKYQFQRRLVYFRCKSGYELVGANSAVCNVNKWSTEIPICIAPGCPPLEYNENVLDVTYTYRGSLATFQCKANHVMEGEDNRVYCNKAKWNKPPPICTKNMSLKKSCDYEDGICGWTQDLSDHFDWKIHSKVTSTKFTGPKNDHTYGNKKEGHYIYIEASAPRRPGDQARLLSPLYNFKMKAACFEFWFHMWCPTSETKEVGTLKVYAIPENKTSMNSAPLQTLTGDYGDIWNRERIQIDPMQDSFQIILQATRGLNHQNDIAVDDVQMWEGLCDDVPNAMYPLPPSTNSLPPSTEMLSKAPTRSSSLEAKTVGTVITDGETIPTTSIQPTAISSTVNTPVNEVMTTNEINEETEPITTQATTSKMLVTLTSSSIETTPTERIVSITNAKTSETTDFMSQTMMDSSSMASITVAGSEVQDNVSDKFNTQQTPEEIVNGKISAKSSRRRPENYTLLAIGITVALLFGIGVIFFIVWVWARSQDRKRAMAEDDKVTQPITNTVSICSELNSFS